MSGIYSLTQLSTLEMCALLACPGVSHVAFSCCTVALEVWGTPHESIVPHGLVMRRQVLHRDHFKSVGEQELFP